MSLYKQEKQIAIEAVQQAAVLCVAVQTDLVQVDSLAKQDKSPVTIADFGAQALVCRHIKKAFPQDPIVGEEDSADLQQPDNADKLAQVTHYVQKTQSAATSEAICQWIDAGNSSVAPRFWTVDPIDGTKGFLRNQQYAVALALIEHGAVQVAALACPGLDNPHKQGVGTLFVAVRGQGSFQAPLTGGEFSQIQVASAEDADGLRFVESVEAAHGDHQLQQELAQAVGISQPSLRMDSQAKYGAVARGDAALYLRMPNNKYPDYREKIWDHAAGSLIVEEAGGRVTDKNGKILDFTSDYKMHDNRGAIVSNGAIHEAVLAVLADQ